MRLGFAGGGTDVPPFPEREGGLVLNATLSLAVRGRLTARTDGRTSLRWTGRGVDVAGAPQVAPAIARYAPRARRGGWDIELRSDVPIGSGLGGSSAAVVVAIGLLRATEVASPDAAELARDAVECERTVLGLPGGAQDHFAAAFGGCNVFAFGNGAVTVDVVPVPAIALAELRERLVLCHSGTTRASGGVIATQATSYALGERHAVAALREQKRLVPAMARLLGDGDVDGFVGLFADACEQKRRLTAGAETPAIRRVFRVAMDAGACSGKVTGAGGGGCVLVLCDPGRRAHVEEAMRDAGIDVVDFRFDGAGFAVHR